MFRNNLGSQVLLVQILNVQQKGVLCPTTRILCITAKFKLCRSSHPVRSTRFLQYLKAKREIYKMTQIMWHLWGSKSQMMRFAVFNISPAMLGSKPACHQPVREDCHSQSLFL